MPYPNAIWHIDANLSLCQWKLYVHGAIDGYSRLVTCLYCSTNNDAKTILKLFIKAGQQYGFPSRERSDFGGENIDVARFMILLRGANRGSHLTGRSVHNQRIERLWRDVFSQCFSLYYHLFYYMESSGIFDCENALHLCALHYVFFARINNSLEAFQQAWNSHSLRQLQDSPQCNSGSLECFRTTILAIYLSRKCFLHHRLSQPRQLVNLKAVSRLRSLT